MLRRSGGSVRAGEDMSWSPTRISPADGSTKPAINRNLAIALGQPSQFNRRHTRPPRRPAGCSAAVVFDHSNTKTVDWYPRQLAAIERLLRPHPGSAPRSSHVAGGG